MEQEIFANYVKGVYKSQSEIHKACKNDWFLLGKVMVLIKKYKEEKALLIVKETEPEKATPTEVKQASWKNCWCCRRKKRSE